MLGLTEMSISCRGLFFTFDTLFLLLEGTPFFYLLFFFLLSFSTVSNLGVSGAISSASTTAEEILHNNCAKL